MMTFNTQYTTLSTLALILTPIAHSLGNVFSWSAMESQPAFPNYSDEHWGLTDFVPAFESTFTDSYVSSWVLDSTFPASVITTMALTYGLQHRENFQLPRNGYPSIAIAAVNFAYLIPSVDAAPPTFIKTLGGTNSESIPSFHNTSDGGYILAGDTRSFGAGGMDILLAKFTGDGTLTWAKTLGGGSTEQVSSVQATLDDGFIVTGHTSSFGAGGGSDMLLAKFEGNSTLTWAKTLGGTDSDSGRYAQATLDGGFIVTGDTSSFGAGLSDLLLAKFSSDGTLTWAKTLGGIRYDWGRSMQLTPDNGFIITGDTYNVVRSGYDMLLAKFDSNGALSWAKTLLGGSSTENDSGQSVQTTLDGGFIVCGYTYSFGTGNDLLLAKFAGNGALTWAIALGGGNSIQGRSVQATLDGGFIVTGHISSAGALLAKFSGNGTLTWAKILSGPGQDYGNSILQTPDTGFIVAGNTNSFGAGNTDIMLAKFDSNGEMPGCSAIQDITANVTVSIIAISESNFSPTVQTINPTVQTWNISAVSQAPTVGVECDSSITTTTTLASTTTTLASTTTTPASTTTTPSSSSSSSASTSATTTSNSPGTPTSESTTEILTSVLNSNSSSTPGVESEDDSLPSYAFVLIVCGASLGLCVIGYTYYLHQHRKNNNASVGPNTESIDSAIGHPHAQIEMSPASELEKPAEYEMLTISKTSTSTTYSPELRTTNTEASNKSALKRVKRRSAHHQPNSYQQISEAMSTGSQNTHLYVKANEPMSLPVATYPQTSIYQSASDAKPTTSALIGPKGPTLPTANNVYQATPKTARTPASKSATAQYDAPHSPFSGKKAVGPEVHPNGPEPKASNSRRQSRYDNNTMSKEGRSMVRRSSSGSLKNPKRHSRKYSATHFAQQIGDSTLSETDLGPSIGYLNHVNESMGFR